jgi:hypothetical protein
MPNAFRSAITAVEYKHDGCGNLYLERMFQVSVLSC